MSILATLLDIVVPVFLIIGAGYFTVRTGAIAVAMIDALVKFGVTVTVPSLLFMAMYRLDLGTALNVWALLAFFIGGTAVFVFAIWLSRRVWKRRPGESVAVGFCAFFPNAVMLGIPISERAFGPETLAAVFGVIAFHSIYNYTIGFVAMEAIRKDGQSVFSGLRRAFQASFTNPLMIGLMLGMFANIVSLPLPQMGIDALDMLGRAALPLALFSIGGVLVRYRLKEEIGEASMVSVLSLFGHPFLAWVLAGPVFGLAEEYVRATVIMAAMPIGINSYIFATIYNRAVGTAASSVLLSTILSIATITLWLGVLGAE